MAVLRNRVQDWARAVRRDGYAVYLAARHPRVPWHVKILALAVAAYALSPIDLIPDFVPVLGYVDDLILVPLGILLVARLVPSEVMTECRAAAAQLSERPASRAGATVIVAIWIAVALATLWVVFRKSAA